MLLLAWNGLAWASSNDHAQEIRNASEAAPKHVTENASYLKFEDGKFVLIKKGSNNFTCFVVHDPNGRFEPSCANEQATRSVLPAYEMHMALLYEGLSYEQTYQALQEAYDRGDLPSAETGSLVYMMSPNNQIYDSDLGSIRPTPVHQMYYYPKLSDETFALGDGPPRLSQSFPHLTALIVDVSPD